MSSDSLTCTWILLGECINGIDCVRCKELNEMLREDERV